MSAALTGPTTTVVQKLCDKLQAQRDTLERQIAALNAVQAGQGSEVSADLLLTLYLCLPSALHVADFATQQGWRVPGAKGPRCVLAKDVYALVRGEPTVLPRCADPVLMQMAVQRLGGNGGYYAGRH